MAIWALYNLPPLITKSDLGSVQFTPQSNRKFWSKFQTPGIMLWFTKVFSAKDQLANWPPKYHKTARTFFQIFYTFSKQGSKTELVMLPQVVAPGNIADKKSSDWIHTYHKTARTFSKISDYIHTIEPAILLANLESA